MAKSSASSLTKPTTLRRFVVEIASEAGPVYEVTAQAVRDALEKGGFVRQARAAKVPITKIASEAGLSRQGVYDLLGERPSS